MKIVYPAIIERDEEAIYATFPDLEGCFTYGDTIEELMDNAKEALSGYILSLIDNNEPVPAPSDPIALSIPPHGYIAFIQSDINPAEIGKCTRKTVTVPLWLNKKALDAHINFSQLLQEALMKKLKIV